MNYCKKCVMPDTKPGLRFNKSGVCFACINAEKKTKINWEKRNKLLHKICNEIRGKNKNGYDCVVPVSGGKDSMYQTYMMSKIYNLTGRTIENNLITYKIIDNDNEISIFFNKKTHDLVGWQNIDLYQNFNITFISVIKKNRVPPKDLFKIPIQD